MIRLVLLLLIACGILCEQATTSTQPWLPKILWTFWQTPLTEKHNILKSFHHNHKKMLPDWQVILLNKETALEWLRKVPDYNNQLQLEYFKRDLPAKRANLIRFALLKHFGGVWVDLTTIITSDFSWLYDLKNQQAVVNAKGQPQILMIYRQHLNQQTHYSAADNKAYLISPAFEIYFIAAAPQNKLLSDAYKIFLQGKAQNWRRFRENKQGRSSIVEMGIAQGIKLGGFDIPYFETEAGIQIALQRKQRQLDKLNTNGERQLSVHYYGAWGMGADKTAFLLNTQQGKNNRFTKMIHLVHQTDINQLKAKNVFPKYFAKLYSDNFHALERFMVDRNMSNNIFKKKITDLRCPETLSILQNSLMYQYVLKDFNKYYQNQIVKVAFNRDCFHPTDPISRIDFEPFSNQQQQFLKRKAQFKIHSIIFLSSLVFLLVFVSIVRALKRDRQIKQKQKDSYDFIQTPQTNR